MPIFAYDKSPALFTDLYQITMAMAYAASGKASDRATFELFFRRTPFKGEYAILAGYDLVKELLENFRFSDEDIRFLKSLPVFKDAEASFFDQLKAVDLSDVEVSGIEEGEIVFPRVPLLQVSGPIFKVQLLESALLNAINFSTLVTTCARRIRMVAEKRGLVEFGLRRAQGPNGAMTATRCAYLGGFAATSNVLAGKNFGIPVVGTMAHSFIQSYSQIQPADYFWKGKSIQKDLEALKAEDGLQTNEGELAAFLAYAKVFPSNTLLLADTYDTIKSGVPNAIRVFRLLRKMGYKPQGIRLDSGDLVYLSKESRKLLDAAGFSDVDIFATNELDEDIMVSLQDQGAEISSYGVGTRLVTAAEQPALGGVYKLVELNGKPRMKISEQTEKMVLPCSKKVYRIFGKDGKMIVDLLTTSLEKAPQVGEEIFALHPTDPFKRAVVEPSRVEELLRPLFKNGKWLEKEMSLEAKRKRSLQKMEQIRADHTRRANPTPYKVAVSEGLKELMESLFNREAPPTHLR